MNKYGPVELYNLGLAILERAQRDMTDSILDLDNAIWKKFDEDQKKTSGELVGISEDGEGLENHCPVCNAEPLQLCSISDQDQEELGIELARKIHKARLLKKEFNDD